MKAVWLETTPIHDVLDVASPGDQSVGQHSAVASPPERFGAHHRGGRVQRRLDEPRHHVAELDRLHVVGVAAKPGRSECDVARAECGLSPTAELLAPHILDPVALQGVRERVLPEVRMLSRGGRGSNVDQAVHVLARQKGEESLDAPGAMTDREDRRDVLQIAPIIAVVADAAILVEGLVKRFGDVRALEGVSFEVRAGTIFGLLGPNGAGKTTAVRVLATILRPDGGRAVVLGHDVVRDADAVRRRIGLAGQNAAVDPNLTGRENLRMIGLLTQLPRQGIMPRAGELLDRFGLSGAADRPLRTYSGGMRRRLDIAASLMGRPPVLLLDEPTTGLDLTSRNQLWDMIRELVSEGTTVLLTTQYLEEADRLAGRVAVVDGGRVIANDSPRKLKAELGDTVIEMEVRGDGRAGRAFDLLQEQLGARIEREEDRLRITSDRGAAVLIAALRVLGDDGLEPDTLTVREPSLDDVFLALTGRHAEGEEQPEEPPARARSRRGAA
jgi:ABC-2 type transport system ATP-binding protein